MKFNKQILREKSNNPSLYYINYGHLKKLLKLLKCAVLNGLVWEATSLHNQFLDVLQSELCKVGEVFAKEINQIKPLSSHVLSLFPCISRHMGKNTYEGMSFDQLLESICFNSNSELLFQLCINLGKMSSLCKNLRRYIIWNSIAVFKIIKKRTRTVDIYYLGECDASQILSSQEWYKSDSLLQMMSSVDIMIEEVMVKVTHTAPSKERYTCPICLDVIVDPVTLSGCFHQFCWNCLAQLATEACQIGQELARCPICRSRCSLDPDLFVIDGVFSRFLRKYFPEDINSRKEQDDSLRDLLLFDYNAIKAETSSKKHLTNTTGNADDKPHKFSNQNHIQSCICTFHPLSTAPHQHSNSLHLLKNTTHQYSNIQDSRENITNHNFNCSSCYSKTHTHDMDDLLLEEAISCNTELLCDINTFAEAFPNIQNAPSSIIKNPYTSHYHLPPQQYLSPMTHPHTCQNYFSNMLQRKFLSNQIDISASSIDSTYSEYTYKTDHSCNNVHSNKSPIKQTEETSITKINSYEDTSTITTQYNVSTNSFVPSESYTNKGSILSSESSIGSPHLSNCVLLHDTTCNNNIKDHKNAISSNPAEVPFLSSSKCQIHFNNSPYSKTKALFHCPDFHSVGSNNIFSQQLETLSNLSPEYPTNEDTYNLNAKYPASEDTFKSQDIQITQSPPNLEPLDTKPLDQTTRLVSNDFSKKTSETDPSDVAVDKDSSLFAPLPVNNTNNIYSKPPKNIYTKKKLSKLDAVTKGKPTKICESNINLKLPPHHINTAVSVAQPPERLDLKNMSSRNLATNTTNTHNNPQNQSIHDFNNNLPQRQIPGILPTPQKTFKSLSLFFQMAAQNGRTSYKVK